jgi:hypothetical protein
MAWSLRLLKSLERLDAAGLSELAEQYREHAAITNTPAKKLSAEIEHLINTQAVASAASQYGIPLVTILCKN